MELARLLVVLALIVFALRKQVSVGVTMFFAGLATALLYQVEWRVVLSSYWALIRSERFLSLTAVIILITLLGSLLKELGYLQRLAGACRNLRGGKRTASALLPFLIGLMPMPGGALLSAPLVDNVLSEPQYQSEFKTATNYWFRHVVEFFWPIYPGIILTEAVTGMPMLQVALMQLPLTLIMIGLGAIFFSRQIDLGPVERSSVLESLAGILRSLWPIAGAIAVFALFKVNMALAVLAATLALIVVARPSRGQLLPSIRKGFSYKLVLMVFGILSFQSILEVAGAVLQITGLAQRLGFPSEVVIVLVCFTIGFLTGMVAAYVGMGYALLAGFLYQPILMPGNILLAYLSGYVGMLLAPTHLCLVLTNQYFKSNLLAVYRLIAFPLFLLAALGFLLSQTGWGDFFGIK